MTTSNPSAVPSSSRGKRAARPSVLGRYFCRPDPSFDVAPPASSPRDGRVTLRPGVFDDADVCGSICFRAFEAIADRHGYRPDFPSAEVAAGFLGGLLRHPGFHSVVAEIDGRVVGSNFLDERSTIAGVGPITVDPALQDGGIGRQLMEAVLVRAAARKFPGVRLHQASYHVRSLSLYTKLGFVAREAVVNMQGNPLAVRFPGYDVRPATEQDLDACDRICRMVHGHDRHGELRDAVSAGTARVVEHLGRVSGYTTQIAFFGHAVGETNRDLMALIAAAPSFAGPGFLVPTSNAELFRWCLDQGLRVVQTMILMSMGLYQEPEGAWLPSVLY